VVGDTLAVRAGLVNDVVAGLLPPALVILPALAGLIWVGVGRSLRPMRTLARHLNGRTADDLRPRPPMYVAAELRPVIAALDGLFAGVERARRRERDFTAFAAHELKTPLAGIKTQAQIARAAAGDRASADAALAPIKTGVARTDRMVRQLLDMAAADAEEAADASQISVRALVEAAAAEVRPVLEARAASLEVDEAEPLTAPPILQLALRNVLENAGQASPPGGVIRCRVGGGGVTVRDAGPGVARPTSRGSRSHFTAAGTRAGREAASASPSPGGPWTGSAGRFIARTRGKAGSSSVSTCGPARPRQAGRSAARGRRGRVASRDRQRMEGQSRSASGASATSWIAPTPSRRRRGRRASASSTKTSIERPVTS
jgi:two-component system, OmpR family, sensor histidine kinase QseC